MSHNSQGFSCFVKVISTRFSEWNLTFHFSIFFSSKFRFIIPAKHTPERFRIFLPQLRVFIAANFLSCRFPLLHTYFQNCKYPQLPVSTAPDFHCREFPQLPVSTVPDFHCREFPQLHAGLRSNHPPRCLQFLKQRGVAMFL